MTPKQFQDLYEMLSKNVNNTNLLGKDLKEQYDKSVNIERNIGLMMENQVILSNQLEEIKKLLLEMSRS